MNLKHKIFISIMLATSILGFTSCSNEDGPMQNSLSYAEATLVFIGYDDHDYSDRTYTALADASELKEYKELKNFNDKMSSCKLFFSKRGNLTEGASK